MNKLMTWKEIEDFTGCSKDELISSDFNKHYYPHDGHTENEISKMIDWVKLNDPKGENLEIHEGDDGLLGTWFEVHTELGYRMSYHLSSSNQLFLDGPVHITHEVEVKTGQVLRDLNLKVGDPVELLVKDEDEKNAEFLKCLVIGCDAFGVKLKCNNFMIYEQSHNTSVPDKIRLS